MIFLISLLLLAEGARQKTLYDSLGGNGNEVIGGDMGGEYYRQDDNSILDSTRGRDTKPWSQRSKRYLESSSNSTKGSTRAAYERAINETVSDYHAQRKAVMDRYYARQREIVEKFGRKNSQPGKTISRTTDRPAMSQQIFGNNVTASGIDNTSRGNYYVERGKKEEDNGSPKPAFHDRGTDAEEKNNSNTGWIYRSSNWNPAVIDDESDIDLRSESSNTLERSVDRREEVAGYYKLGNFKGSKDEKVVYQHNLGVGLKGSSQLDATFEAVIEGPYEITTVEAFPYANTRANFTWLSGGPGTNFVKLKLQGYENEGFSYSVKVWGVPKTT